MLGGVIVLLSIGRRGGRADLTDQDQGIAHRRAWYALMAGCRAEWTTAERTTGYTLRRYAQAPRDQDVSANAYCRRE
jgi:hypothetical protein